MTEALPLLAPVVEAPGNRDREWPWVVSDRRAFSFLRLGGGMAAGDIGLVFAQLVDYNGIEGRDTEALWAGIIEAQAPSMREALTPKASLAPERVARIDALIADALASGALAAPPGAEAVRTLTQAPPADR